MFYFWKRPEIYDSTTVVSQTGMITFLKILREELMSFVKLLIFDEKF